MCEACLSQASHTNCSQQPPSCIVLVHKRVHNTRISSLRPLHGPQFFGNAAVSQVPNTTGEESTTQLREPLSELNLTGHSVVQAVGKVTALTRASIPSTLDL